MPSTEPRSVRAVLVAALLAGLLLAACGSDDSDEGAVGTDAAADDDGGTAGSGDSDDTDDSGEDDDSGDGESASGAGACELISDDEIASALGVTPDEREYSEGTAGSYESCEWILPAPESRAQVGIPPMVSLVLMDADGYTDRTENAGDVYQPFPGLGDEAVWTFTGMEEIGYSGQVLVRVGDDAFHLIGGGLTLGGEDEGEQAFTALAETVLDDL